jgi:hypothetical protein
MKLRIVHKTYKEFGSKMLQHLWVGQVEANGQWEDYTNMYSTEEKAELNLLRLIVEDLGYSISYFELGENK